VEIRRAGAGQLAAKEGLRKLMRFATVGALSAAVYFAAVALLIESGMVGPRLASVLAYLVSVTLSFAGHRFHTFRSNGRLSAEAIRFIATHLAGMAVMFATMHVAVDMLDAPFWVGSAMGTLIVPAISFVVLILWVFPDELNRDRLAGRAGGEN
jgi:putative flippase GtrA